MLYCNNAFCDINDGLVAYYPFEGDVEDYTGNYSGISYNSISFKPGISGLSASFNGLDSYIKTNTVSESWPTWSVGFFVKINDIRRSIIFEREVVGEYYDFEIGLDDQNVLRIENDNGDYPVMQSIKPLRVGEWYHIVVTYDGNEKKLYINGDLDYTIIDKNSLISVKSPFLIGRHVNSSYPNYFSGYIDELRVYKRALSGSDVLLLYNKIGKIIFSSSGSEVEAASNPNESSELFTKLEDSIGNLCNGGFNSPGPFLVSNGDYFHDHTDINIPALGLPLAITRYYNSIDLYDGPFGHGWNLDYTARLIEMESENATSSATVHLGNGVRRKFTLNTDGSYSPPTGQDDTLVRNVDGSFTFNGQCETCGTKPRKAYHFNTDGALTAIADPNGNLQTISYNTDGRIQGVSDPNGRSLTFAYGANGRVATITDFDSRVWTYGYDDDDNLISVTDPLTNTISYQYDENHNLTAIIDAKGQTVSAMTYDESDKLRSFTDNGGTYGIDYDPVSQVTSKTNPAGGLFTFTYDANGNITNKLGPQGKSLTMTWDQNVNVSSKVSGRNVVTAYTWDEDHNLSSVSQDASGLNATTVYGYDPVSGKPNNIVDPRGNITSMVYDPKGNLLELHAPIGSSTNTYNVAGQLVRSEDPDGYVTAREYDANGYLTRVYVPDTSIQTVMTYDVRGNLLTRTDPNGSTTSYTYDAIDRLKTVTDALGNATQFEYDANDNLVRTTDPAGTQTNFVYDAQDRLVTRIDGMGGQTQYTYDNLGNVLTVTDPLGNTTTYTYDELSRVIRVENSLGHAWQFAYDSSDNLTARTDPNGNVTAYSFDALNRLTSVVEANGVTTRYEYDKNGNMLAIVDGNGVTSASSDYDANNRPTAHRDGLGHETRMTYSAGGRLLTRTNAKGEVTSHAYEPHTGRLATITYASGRKETFSYDTAGNLVSVTDTQTGAAVSLSYDALNRVATETQLGQTLSYTYDASGNRETLTLPGVGTYTYDFDALNRLISIVNPQGETTSFTYDAAGRRTRLTYGNGAYSAYDYDQANRLASIMHHKSDGSLLTFYAYGYDNMNNRQSVVENNSTIISYSYDSTYKLLAAATGNQTVSFTYDPVGNRLSRSDEAGTATYAYDDANRLLSQNSTDGGSAVFTYDEVGRLQTKVVTTADLSSQTFTFTYDEKDQLVAVTSSAGVNNQYAYDPLGRRIRAVNSQGVRRFIYDGQNPLADISGDDATPLYSLIYTPALDLDVLAGYSESGQSRYYLRDGLNSVREVLGADAAPLAGYEYQPYGRIKAQSGVSESDFTFTGRRLEADSGLMYYRTRYYDPDIGRFLKKDSYAGQINDPLSLHRYGYVHGNPVSHIDPTGEFVFTTIVIGSTATYYAYSAITAFAVVAISSSIAPDIAKAITDTAKQTGKTYCNIVTREMKKDDNKFWSIIGSASHKFCEVEGEEFLNSVDKIMTANRESNMCGEN